MSLGRPDLYIGGQKMQTAKADPRPLLAGLKLSWGGDSQFDFDPPATLSGQLLIRGALPDYLDTGTPVGLVDPWSTRSLFAGTLEPLRAVPEPALAGAYRVSFTASSPISELQRHTVTEVDWPSEEHSGARVQRIREALPAGWQLSGPAGPAWLPQGQQRHPTIEWMVLAERYFRGNFQRIHDTSVYIPGAGLTKRLSITPERHRGAWLPAPATGPDGVWVESPELAAFGASGTAVIPPSAIAKDGLEWEKTPEDVVTGVQVTTYGGALVGSNDADESSEWEWPLNWQRDNSALIREFGQRIARVETALSPQHIVATKEMIRAIQDNWLDARTAWRPTTLILPDSRRLSSAVLLNLLSTHSRGRAAVNVPAITNLPGRIRAFVLGGNATWDGKKWITELTLGRTQY